MRYLLLIPLIFAFGCANPEKAIYRESMDQGTRTIREQHKDWAGHLVAAPDGTDTRNQIPQLTREQYDQILKTHTDYETYRDEDRARDKGGQ